MRTASHTMMKNKLLHIRALRTALGLLLIHGTAVSQVSAAEPEICLMVVGCFENAFDYDDLPCTVLVFRDDKVIDSLHVKRGKKFRYHFEKKASYCLRVIKPGFIPLIVNIDTNVPERKKNDLYRFDFETRLISEKRAKTFNQDLLGQPLALIRFDQAKNRFNYDEEYTKLMKMQMVLNSAAR
jgi:hypothetical protein